METAQMANPVAREPEESTRFKMEAIGRLAGGVAHDFNNLLTVITGCTQMLIESDSSKDERRLLLNDIAEAANRASTLTHQLLAFSRRQTLRTEAVDVASHLGGLNSMLRRLVGEHIDFHFFASRDCGAARIDAGQIDQVIVNLVVNARDSMPAGGRLELAAESLLMPESRSRDGVLVPAGSYVRITVSDTGEGMSPDVLPHIFEPFYTTKRKRGGTGLGLATVYGIVKQHGGFIFVTSVPGRGSRFELLFTRTETVRRALEPATVSISSRTSGASVLVVEDEAVVAKLASQLLCSAGHTVRVASDGVEALQVLAAHAEEIDVVFTDVLMPRMGGPELARCASQKWGHLAFLFTSGYVGDDLSLGWTLPKGVDILMKPYTRSLLLSRLQSALGLRKIAC